jgi:hypothetical protein
MSLTHIIIRPTSCVPVVPVTACITGAVWPTRVCGSDIRFVPVLGAPSVAGADPIVGATSAVLAAPAAGAAVASAVVVVLGAAAAVFSSSSVQHC